MSETPISNDVINMAEFKARKEVKAAEFNVPQPAQFEPEALRDALEAEPKPSVAPVVELHDGRAHVRTVEGGQVIFNPHRENYEPLNVELAPESQVIFKAALDIMKARETMTSDILSEPVSVVANGAYVDMLTQERAA